MAPNTDDNTHNTKSNKKPRLRPVLKDLCLTNYPKEEEEEGDGVTAIDVLQQLLETNVVTEEAVRAAYQTAESNRKPRENSNLPLIQEAPAPAPVPAPAPAPPVYRTRHIALRFYYDGSKYTGLAENIGFAADQSVEKELFKALRKAKLIDARATSDYTRCGRTDKGVSAVGQVMALQLKSAFHEQASWDEGGMKLLETKDLVHNSRDTLTVWAPRRKHKDDSTGTIVRQQKELSEYAFDQILNNFLPVDIRIIGKSSPPVPESTVRTVASQSSFPIHSHRLSLLIVQLGLPSRRSFPHAFPARHERTDTFSSNGGWIWKKSAKACSSWWDVTTFATFVK
jgi:hypothetical protein